MKSAHFITAIGTPLTEDEALHEQGLEAHLADQRNSHIDGILVGGTMGAMQLLTEETYRRLVRRAVELWAGHGEIFVGAGDTGLARTRERILFLNQFQIDGVAVLAPYSPLAVFTTTSPSFFITRVTVSFSFTSTLYLCM